MATTDKDVETAKTITVEERIDELRKRRKAALTPGGRDAAKKQHDRGKLTARERVELLMDRHPSWRPTWPCTGRTTSDGRSARPATASSPVTGTSTVGFLVASQDFAVFGGSMGEVHAQKVCKVMDLAISTGAPFVQINDSGGARIQEGAASLAGYGFIFERNVRASGASRRSR